MNKRTSGAKLGRKKSGREALIRNQIRSLFTYGFLVTTTPKAKALKSEVESFLSKTSEDSLQTQRTLYSVLGNASLVQKASKLLKEGENKVGIIKVGFRDGDNAETSKVSLLSYEDVFGKKKKSVRSKKKDKKEEKKKGETEFVEEKKDDKVVEKGEVDKSKLNIKDRFINKERARSRSGI